MGVYTMTLGTMATGFAANQTVPELAKDIPGKYADAVIKLQIWPEN
jgi:hypothetical protein